MTPTATTEVKPDVLKMAEQFINKYATLAHERYLLPLVLWAAATHMWPSFDTFPYLVITAYVKRAGKTRLMELMQLISANGKTFSPDSPSSMFTALSTDKPTMFIDEAEKLNQEGHPAREFLNKGYRRGQTITRIKGGEVTDFECFGPKAFVLIGDVYDTLRDRCIVVTMRRRTPVESASANQFRMSEAETQAETVRATISAIVEQQRGMIENAYATMNRLTFLTDRDEELWAPLFALAMVLCPNRVDELIKDAVDIATEKTADRRNFRQLLEEEEKKADDADARILLLRDMLKLTDGHNFITSANLIEQLKQIPTSPWRTFRGLGLTQLDAASLLDSMHLKPKPMRVLPGKTTKGAIQRAYSRADLLAAARLAGLL